MSSLRIPVYNRGQTSLLGYVLLPKGAQCGKAWVLDGPGGEVTLDIAVRYEPALWIAKIIFETDANLADLRNVRRFEPAETADG